MDIGIRDLFKLPSMKNGSSDFSLVVYKQMYPKYLIKVVKNQNPTYFAFHNSASFLLLIMSHQMRRVDLKSSMLSPIDVQM